MPQAVINLVGAHRLEMDDLAKHVLVDVDSYYTLEVLKLSI